MSQTGSVHFQESRGVQEARVPFLVPLVLRGWLDSALKRPDAEPFVAFSSGHRGESLQVGRSGVPLGGVALRLLSLYVLYSLLHTFAG